LAHKTHLKPPAPTQVTPPVTAAHPQAQQNTLQHSVRKSGNTGTFSFDRGKH